MLDPAAPSEGGRGDAEPGARRGQRAALCAAGVAAARAARYRNAGTVEFLLDPDGRFYFLEMNTRLQVEHPVTEAVTGLDLVRLQLEIAAGRPLSVRRATSRSRATRSSAASTPRTRAATTCRRRAACSHLVLPEGPGIRVDSGSRRAARSRVHYDPLLAKIVAWGRDRGEAISRLQDACGGRWCWAS